MPVVTFEPISIGKFPPITNFSDLSADQKYLRRVLTAVDEGYCSQELTEMVPGPINHARWLTLASRTIRLYMEEAPTISESF